MATECTQDAVLRFLTERGGKVRNVDLIDQFKPFILNDPAKKALAKERFKEFVDTVGFVKVENDVKYVCLKKKYRDTLKQRAGKKTDGDNAGSGIKGGPGTQILGLNTSQCPKNSADCSRGFEEDNRSLALDPMEHEWMMCASDGQWESLNRLLACDPNLVIKKDFVTGFTCLHWAAKHGKQELIALLVNFAKQHAVPLNINTRSSAGYTPLHLAAMHNHEQVVKLLVGAYDADVNIRDYSGKKAWQYLREDVDGDIRDIVGAAEHSDADSLGNGAGRWRLSKVLPSNLLPHKLLNLPEDDSCGDGAAVKPKSVDRKTSMSRIRPKLKQIRFKTQVIHSSFFKETEDGERPLKSPAKSRPKSNLFG
ncbi:UNVERIFIED_CONTAM: hypothetical protein FKN15_056505 [Acipenser sinensis]